MGSSIFFPISALPIIIIIIIIFNIKGHIASAETKMYNSLILVNLFALIVEILCSFACTSIEQMPFISMFILRFYLVLLLCWTALFTNYIYIITYDKENKKNDLIQKIFLIIVFIFIFILPMDVIVQKNNQIHYTTGLSCYFSYGVSLIYSLIIIYMLLRNRRKIFNKKYIPVFFFFIIGLLSIVIQINRPEILLLTYCETLICLLMFHTIENPDVKMIEQLQIARDQANKANQSKTEFLSSMSHEIRTPLNAIVGFSDCIIESNTLEEAKENAKDIVSASDTLLEIVNGILDISKIEAGKLEIVNSKYNAFEVFNELAKLITPRMKDKGLDFTYHIDPTLPRFLYGDHASIKKIVTNLLSNACKYTSHGFVHYDVSCVRMGDIVRLIISVEDSGRGIKKDSIEKMFTKFQRLDEDRNTTIEGTGLGLAITKQLAELMGGKIICHTIYGEGSKFTAVINQRIEKDDDINDNKDSIDTDSVDLSGLRILVVDDTPLNIKVAIKLLQRYKANVIDSCSSGFDCINKIKSGSKYDLILLDDMMPKLSGTETLAKLKEIPGFNTFTVALTANALTGMKEKYINSGFDDYLSKPIEISELIRVANKLLVNDFEDCSPTEKEVLTDDEKKEKDKVVPVEDNIEEILGSQLDLSDRTSNTQILENIENDNIEVLDMVDEPEIVSTIDLVPVVEKENNKNLIYDRKYLEMNGCDFNNSLELLGDVSMYNSTVCDFLAEIDDKWDRIINYKNSGDMNNYSIEVHSLKSDCKYLGFMKLADIAYQHELQSKENNVSYINNNFNQLENEYNRVIDIIRNYSSQNPSDL